MKFKNNKGFTLVELLGVIVILAIIMGLAVIGYMNVRKLSLKSYYKGIEEEILLSANDYYEYNKNAIAQSYGDVTKVFLKQLVDEKYISNIVDQNGESCDLENSYVMAYKVDLDKVNYDVCLICGEEYQTESEACNGNIGLLFKMNATIGDIDGDNIVDTLKTYREGIYTKGLVILHFKVTNGITKVHLNDNNKTEVATCNIDSGNNECTINVNQSGTYVAYAEQNGNNTKEEKIKILIDNELPTFNIKENNEIITTNQIKQTNEVKINVTDINDSLSGVRRIRYSFGSKEDFVSIESNKTNFEIEKEGLSGVYNLIVEVTDNAGNVTKKIIEYNFIKGVSIPTTSLCNELTYNGRSQKLINETEGLIFENNEEIDAGNHTVTAKLMDYYKYIGTDSRDDIDISCLIKKKQLEVVANSNQNKTYGSTDPTLQYTPNGLIDSEIAGFEGSLTRSEGENVGTYPILIGSLKLKDNDSFKANNYELVYRGNTFTITPKEITPSVVLSETTYEYDGGEKKPGVTVKDGSKTLVAGVDYTITYQNNVNVGEGKVVVTLKGNYTGSKEESFTITKKVDEVTISAKASTYTGNKIEANAATSTSGSNITYTYYSSTNCTGESLSEAPTNVGNYSVKAVSVGNANYSSGNKCVTHTITPKEITPSVVLSETTYEYDGGEKKPGVTVKDGSKTLVAGVDYTITYQNNVNVGEGKVVVTLKGNYTGSKEESFTITSINPTLILSETEGTIGVSNTITINVTSNVSGKYTISSSPNNIVEITPTTTNSINANTPTTISLRGIYNGNTTITVLFTPDSSNYNQVSGNYTARVNGLATIGSCNSLVYNGNDQVLVSGGTNINFSNNIGHNAGSYTVTMTTNTGYSFSDNTTSKTIQCIIEKATPTLTVNGIIDSLSTMQDIEVDIISSVDGNLRITSGNINILELYELDQDVVEDDGSSEITFSNVLSNAEKSVVLSASGLGNTIFTIQMTPDDTTNYESVTKSFDIETKARYCADFYANGSLGVGSSGVDTTAVCCDVLAESDDDQSCQITLPSIIPSENFEVIGWSNDNTIASNLLTEKTHDVGDNYTLTDNSSEFFALTKSTESASQTHNITFVLNGATSFNYEGVDYTENNTFTCSTDYAINGLDIPNSCSITLPTITRSDGTTYGWSIYSNNHGEPEYLEEQVLEVNTDITLYAISSKTITLSIDANGGTTTLEDQVVNIFDNALGAWFLIPEYDRVNMCRAKANNYNGFKYKGLTSTAGSTTVNICQGDRVYLTEDTTYHAIWSSVYATAKVSTSGSNLALRSGRGTSYSTIVYMPNGSSLSVTGPSATGGSYKWWPVIYSGKSGFAATNYVTTPNTSNIKNSCEYTDYSCTSSQPATTLSITPDDVLLNFADNTTTTNLTINSTCGNIVSVDNTNPSIVTATSDGLLTAVSGSVSYKEESKTSVLTYTTDGGCSEVVNVTVANIEMDPPTISMTAEGESVSEGFKTGAKVTATCNSASGISSNSLSGGGDVTTESSTLTQEILSTNLNTNGNIRVTATCTGENGITTTVVNTYKIYVYGTNSACSCKEYNTCTTSACGTTTTTTYGSWSNIQGSSCASSTSTRQCKAGTWHSAGGNEFCLTPCRSIKKVTKNKTCACSACGCKTRNSCWHV